MDINIIFKIAAVGIITAIVGQVLKKADKATLTTLAGLVIVLLMVVDLIAGLFDTLKTIFGLYSLWI